MLTARKSSVWSNSYDISCDGGPITRWRRSTWRTGGTFTLAGQDYQVQARRWQTEYTMTVPDGGVVAVAKRVGRKRWTVDADNRTYAFERTSPWRLEQSLMRQGQTIGTIKRTSWWRSDASADLPGLPLHIQVFVLAVMLIVWDGRASGVAAGAAGS